MKVGIFWDIVGFDINQRLVANKYLHHQADHSDYRHLFSVRHYISIWRRTIKVVTGY
jgi:hypothetical protein